MVSTMLNGYIRSLLLLMVSSVIASPVYLPEESIAKIEILKKRAAMKPREEKALSDYEKTFGRATRYKTQHRLSEYQYVRLIDLYDQADTALYVIQTSRRKGNEALFNIGLKNLDALLRIAEEILDE